MKIMCIFRVYIFFKHIYMYIPKNKIKLFKKVNLGTESENQFNGIPLTNIRDNLDYITFT
jgi:hypothetical protein